MRTATAILLVAAFGLAGCGSGSDGDEGTGPDSGPTALSISYRPTPNAEPSIARLDCARPGAGQERRACREVESIPAGTFDPVPPDRACTEIYGGPETARIVGTVEGGTVDADFSRVNGCEIERWESVSFLLEATGLTGAG